MGKIAVSPQQAAELLGVSRTTIYELIRAESFPSFKCGNRRLISVKDLELWVHEQATRGMAI